MSFEGRIGDPFLMENCGIVVIGHGTRNQAGQDQFKQLFERMLDGRGRQILGCEAEYAFLELAEPSIGTSLQSLAERGVRELVVVPALLFSAGHAQSDIPSEVSTEAERLGMRVIAQSPALCCEPSMIEVSGNRFREALLRCPRLFTSENTGLAMIGRGSSSDDATAAMLQFADLRIEKHPVAWSTTGFIHAQRPNVDEALDGLAATGLPCLVVQPHLLFEGKLMDDLRNEIEYRQRFTTTQIWLLVEPLGPDPIIANLLKNLIAQSIDRNMHLAGCLPSHTGNCSRCGMTRQFC